MTQIISAIVYNSGLRGKNVSYIII